MARRWSAEPVQLHGADRGSGKPRTDWHRRRAAQLSSPGDQPGGIARRFRTAAVGDSTDRPSFAIARSREHGFADESAVERGALAYPRQSHERGPNVDAT